MKKFIRNSVCIALAMTALCMTACTDEQTNHLLAVNGTTDYSIVIGTDADQYEKFAAEELQNLFKEATGATLPIKTETEVAFSENAKVISIGDNSFQEASGVTPVYNELKTAGNIIVNKGESIILTGAQSRGSLHAVYDFLNVLFGYEYYEENAYVIKKVDTVEIPSLNLKNIPDFDKFTFGDKSHYENLGGSIHNAWRQRILFDDNDTVIGGHSATHILPMKDYYADHPDWFSDNSEKWQICYSSEGALQQYIENCKQLIREAPEHATLFSFCDRDYSVWCQCSNCKKLIQSYDLKDADGKLLMAGPNSITGIIFKSKAADALDKWVQQEYPGRHMRYYAHAYFEQRTPPVYRDPATGKYTLLTNGQENDPLKNVNPNIEWQVAAIEANRNQSWEDNVSQGEELRRWSRVSSNIIVYDYPQDAANVLTPYDGLHTHADNMRFAHSLGHQAYKYQGNYNTQSGGFYDLRKYVCSKLAWDLSLDPNELAENYLRVTCGPAYEYMSELYKIERTRIAKMREENSYGGHCLGDNTKSVNWPRELIHSMQVWVDKAYEAIDYLQYEDPAYYEAVFRRVKIEELTLQYINLSLYRSYYSVEDKNALIDEFEMYSKKYGATLYSESDPMTERIAQWRKS